MKSVKGGLSGTLWNIYDGCMGPGWDVQVCVVNMPTKADCCEGTFISDIGTCNNAVQDWTYWCR
jgi:hypothetical protein